MLWERYFIFLCFGNTTKGCRGNVGIFFSLLCLTTTSEVGEKRECGENVEKEQCDETLVYVYKISIYLAIHCLTTNGIDQWGFRQVKHRIVCLFSIPLGLARLRALSTFNRDAVTFCSMRLARFQHSCLWRQKISIFTPSP